MASEAPPSSETKRPAVSSKPPWLQSIKIRIMVFALAATIIPAITLGSLSYLQNTRFLSEKISQELRDATSQVSREIDLLIKEKLYDVRVFASSYVVSENLLKILRADGAHVEHLVAMSLIQEYLQSVRAKFADYVELMILDLEGRRIASSATDQGEPVLPVGWRERIDEGQAIVGQATYDQALQTRVILIADAIRAPGGDVIGILGAKLSLDAMDRVLAAYSQTDIRETYLVNQQGKVLASSHLFSAPSRRSTWSMPASPSFTITSASPSPMPATKDPP